MKNSVRSTVIAAAVLVSAVITGTHEAAAAEPPVNTGGTSFMDGFGDPRGSGFSYMQYAQFATKGAIKDQQGNDVPVFKNPRLNVFADLNQFLYTFKTEGWIAHPGVYTIVPLVALNTSFGAGGASMTDNGFGLGDMVLGTYAQFEPIISGGRPVFTHRLDMGVIVPTGKYDPTKTINPGMNTVSLNPSWAATVLPIPQLEISSRLNYLYNFQNGNPGAAPDGTPMSSTQAGQAIFENFAASYEFLPFNPQRTGAYSLRAGVNGYYFRQFTDSKVNGVSQPNSQEQVLALGPGVMWIATKDDAFWFNVYFETAVENRFAGDVFQARWARTF